MNFHEVTVEAQFTALHTVSAGLTITSIAGALGYLPVIIAACAGVAAIISYTFATLDSPSFQRRVAIWTFNRKQRQLQKLRKQQVILAAKLQALATIESAHAEAEQMISNAKQGVLSPSNATPVLKSNPQP